MPYVNSGSLNSAWIRGLSSNLIKHRITKQVTYATVLLSTVVRNLLDLLNFSQQWGDHSIRFWTPMFWKNGLFNDGIFKWHWHYAKAFQKVLKMCGTKKFCLFKLQSIFSCLNILTHILIQAVFEMLGGLFIGNDLSGHSGMWIKKQAPSKWLWIVCVAHGALRASLRYYVIDPCFHTITPQRRTSLEQLAFKDRYFA